METRKDRMSDAGDGEDIPSDFFDDFNKDEFIEGLSVIDSWDDEKAKPQPRFNAEAFDGVKDLRELMKDEKQDRLKDGSHGKYEDKKRRKRETPRERRPTSGSRLDEFIKPGSRRDPNKTNEAIKKDKEEKVKEYLAKHLESAEYLRPPGTELDDFFAVDKTADKRKTPVAEEVRQLRQRSRSRERRHRESPGRLQRPLRSPRWSPGRSPRCSQRRSSRHSPHRNNWRPNVSPQRNIKRQYSPHRRSPRRISPRHSPRRLRRSRSPYKRSYGSRRSTSRSPQNRDSFLYPQEYDPLQTYAQDPAANVLYQQYASPAPGEFPGSVPGYTFTPAYTGGYSAPYDYGAQPPVAGMLSQAMPQPVTGPILNPVTSALTALVPNAVTAPAMVPAPSIVSPVIHPDALSHQIVETKTPYDALAQLVAEGKISKEDYLKLAPNKGVSSPKDTKNRVMVLNRCNQALGRLGKLLLPNRLLMNNNMIGPEPKYLAPKYGSPLKRQAAVEFHFTKTNGSATAQQNKQLVDSIIATIGLEKVISRPKKKIPKDMKDAACQTAMPYCDVCEIRDSTKSIDAGTSIDPEHFYSTVHTQVLEKDLLNSKSVFNPSGSVADGAPISIAHLTPAQLVSQLAARAKTLKQSSESTQPNQFSRRNPPNNYDYDARGGGQQYNNYNYRY